MVLELVRLTCIAIVVGTVAIHTTADNFSHHITLDQQAHFKLEWRSNVDSITFRVSVRTRGYIGLGFSPSGGMHGADIALAWVSGDGKVHLSDRNGIGNHAPSLDTQQDLVLDLGYENDTHTVIQFSRPWQTCDSREDMQLGPDTVKLIWAYSDEDPDEAVYHNHHRHLPYHSVLRRGSRSVHLAEPAQSSLPLPNPHRTWDLRADRLELPEDDHTHYWCKIYRAPDLNHKHHMIALEPLIEPGHESYVHHMVLYECHIPHSQIEAAGGATTADWFQRHVDQPGQPCYSPNMPAEWSFCLATNAWAWAVGSTGERLPKHTGMPLGEAYGGATYFMLETHYDNPALHTPIIDNSGIRIHYTDQLRPYDTGMLLVGSEVNFLQFIPPRQNSFTSVGHCSAECTSAGLPESGIKIISGVLHSHLAGRRMRLRHIRRGVELAVILQDNHYDFNYQASRIPPQETTVYPGDQLMLECDYDTSSRTDPTFGGLSTREEMCLGFILYYPRSALADCRSLPALHTLTNALGIEEIYGRSFERLVEFMKDIGADGSSSTAIPTTSSGSTLSNLLNSLSTETGYHVPSLPQRPSAGPLTEEDILAKPFYVRASPEPEPPPQGTNYRTMLMDLLLQIRIRAPASLHNKTIGHVFNSIDWREEGSRINKFMTEGEHNSLCLAHGRQPLIPYKLVTYPRFKPLPSREPDQLCPSYEPVNRQQPILPLLKSSTNCLSAFFSSFCLLFIQILPMRFHLYLFA